MVGQLVGDREHGGAHPLIVGRQEAHDRDQQARGVERVGVVVLDEHAALVDAAARGCPRGSRRRRPASGRRAPSRRAARPVARRGPSRPSTSASRRRSGCGSPRASQIPWSGFCQTRQALATWSQSTGHRRSGMWSRALGVQVDGVEHRAEARRSGAGCRRRCRPAPAAIPRSPSGGRASRSRRSRSPPIPYMICSEPSSLSLEVGHELHEVVGLPVEAERVQPPQREGRVAHPAVAVVPVALAAGRLGQRGRQRPRPSRRSASR